MRNEELGGSGQPYGGAVLPPTAACDELCHGRGGRQAPGQIQPLLVVLVVVVVVMVVVLAVVVVVVMVWWWLW